MFATIISELHNVIRMVHKNQKEEESNRMYRRVCGPKREDVNGGGMEEAA
jgi:hypothetical protein